MNSLSGVVHEDFKRILAGFLRRFGEADGVVKYREFLELNGLDECKGYRPSTQFESFHWVEPLISMYREDAGAKYYKVVALTANVSMNNNDFSDYSRLVKSEGSMNWRPVNMNHDHGRWLEFPRTRVDLAKADDLSIEAILRVDNLDGWLQELIEAKKVVHPSIECRRLPDSMGGEYHFTGMALLEKGVAVPGDPLTTIEPLFMNESIGSQACRVIDGEVVCNGSGKEVVDMVEKIKENRVVDELQELVESKDRRILDLQGFIRVQEGKLLKLKVEHESFVDEVQEPLKRLQVSNRRNRAMLRSVLQAMAKNNQLFVDDDGKVVDPDTAGY